MKGSIKKKVWNLRERRGHLGALRSLLEGNGLLLTHSRDDGDKEIFAFVEVGLDLLAHVTLGKLDVVLGGAVLSHQVEEAVIDVDLEACVRSEMGCIWI